MQFFGTFFENIGAPLELVYFGRPPFPLPPPLSPLLNWDKKSGEINI